MRTLFLLCVGLLVGCAGQEPISPLPEVVYIHDDKQSLKEICRSLEVYAVEVGLNRLARKNRISKQDLEENVTALEVNQVLQNDMVVVIDTMYQLPIETYKDVDAVAYLIYKNCMLKQTHD